MRLVFKQKEANVFSLDSLSEFYRTVNNLCETACVVTAPKSFTEIRIRENPEHPNITEVLFIVELLSSEEPMLNLAKEKWKVIGERYNWILIGVLREAIDLPSLIEIQLNNDDWLDNYDSRDGNQWTTEKFRRLIPEHFSHFYESRNQMVRLCELGIDLMNLVQEEAWGLTPKFNKYYFALYFGRRRVFGIRLQGHPRLVVLLPEDILLDQDYDWFDSNIQFETYAPSHGWAIYPEQRTVADIRDILEFAYLWHTDLQNEGR